MKNVALIIFFVLALLQPAFCDTAVFHVSATIPRIQGVNFFPESADIVTPAELTEQPKVIIQQLVLREGKKIILQTSVIK